MKLIISEKPKVAQKIAEALADGKVERKKGKGQAYYFEFERNGERVAVSPAVGHIYSLEEKTKSNTYPSFEIEWRPAYETSKDADYTKGYIQTIEMLSKDADEIIIACDYDVEGSLIGYNALRYAAHRDVGTRMKFSALTKNDLQQAYMDRSNLDIENALAGESRHMLDWYYGINLSRALMSSIKAVGKFQIMSIGRVQGPALKLLSDKEKSILAFVPTPYWELTCEIDKTLFKHECKKFTGKNEAEKAFASSKPKPHKIIKITKKPFEQNPSPPFDLTSLQVEAYRQFKFSPKQTQSLAQTLYESSLISYPRTSSQKLPAKLGLEKIIMALSAQAEYTSLCKKLSQARMFKPLEGKKQDPAHPAIHPTGQFTQTGIKEKKLYDLIVRRFLACFAPPAKREGQKVVALCSTQNYTTAGARTIFAGWHEFYKPYVKLDEITLPEWKEGQDADAQNFKMEEKMTQPPKRFTPASIISELENRNLGTKSTRATVVDTLFKRGYLSGTKSIEVTQFGMQVADTMQKYAPDILSEEMTRDIEKEMEAIKEDHVHAKNVVENGKKILIKTLENYKKHEKDVGEELSSALAGARAAASIIGPCPKCGKDLKKLISRFKKQFVGCSGYPDCTQTYPLPQMALIEATGRTCPKCSTPIIKVIRRAKRPFEMCVFPECETKANWGKYPKKTAAKKFPAQAKSAAPTSALPAKKTKTQSAASKPAKKSPAPKKLKKLAEKESTPKTPRKRKLSAKKQKTAEEK
ncbi:DNA topoisomerase I [Candidatus Micrarchaeota archaeon CG10_big_fil_rev_8_21_14_0_10_45_29]|nr:MAG: DNA topoisomerase I [Candidatus Micrarchaeota archaeon CG10_big_fil_rev_8_21_14_0_10_45_29]